LSTLRKLLFQKAGSKSPPKQSFKLTKNKKGKSKDIFPDEQQLQTQDRGKCLKKVKNKMGSGISKNYKHG